MSREPPKKSPLPSDIKNLDSKFEDVLRSGLTDDDLKEFIHLFVYKGFDRKKVRAQALSAGYSPKQIGIASAVVGLRGPKKAKELLTGPISNLPASGNQGNDSLTLHKIHAAFPEAAALILKRIDNVNPLPKRIVMDLPAWLQFPAAASLPLDDIKRGFAALHLDWARRFSLLLPGGVFNEDIYSAMKQDQVSIGPDLLSELRQGL
jgi:hypothetical protein